MFSRKSLVFSFCAFLCAIFLLNFKVSAAPVIDRIGGADRYETSVKISQSNWKESKYVVLVSGESFADALCAAPLAKKYDAPILLTESIGMGSSITSELKRLGAKNVFIVGGTGVVSEDVESQLKNMEISSTRIQGKRRYETSIEVAKYIGTGNGIVMTSGEDFPDALSAASIAASKQMPILLTYPDFLLDSTKDFVKTNKENKYYVVGGEAVVSKSITDYLGNYKRLSGSNRYETNTAVINEFLGTMNISTVHVASGEGFADALSGSAAAAKMNSPIVLVHNSYGSQQPVVKSNIDAISSIKILGGAGVVSYEVVQRLIKGESIKITLDPGHGGYDSGAVGPTGVKEKDVTLAVALKVGKILQQNGIDVVYTRTSDSVSWPSNVSQDLQKRCDISDAAGSKYFVSIHANSADATAARGTETYYYDGSSEGRRLAEEIQTQLINTTGFIDRGIKTANFYVLRNTSAPSVLVELGFISNPREEALLAEGEFQGKLAQAIAKGIIQTVSK